MIVLSCDAGTRLAGMVRNHIYTEHSARLDLHEILSVSEVDGFFIVDEWMK